MEMDLNELRQETIDKNTKIECKVCGRVYTHKSNLKIHLKSHFQESDSTFCSVCGQQIKNSKFKAHLASHNDEPQHNKIGEYMCRYCGLKFDKANARSSHEMRIHKLKENEGFDNFRCKEEGCSMIFRTQEELRDHGFEHFTGKIHFCDFPGCERKFKKGKLLTVHKKCHFEPQVKCLDCGQMFVQRAGLLKHQKFKRCPMAKTKEAEPSQEVIQHEAQIAFDQFIELKGKLKTSTEDPKEISDDFIEDIESLSDFIEEESFEQFAEEEMIVKDQEWHYEYLEENVIETVYQEDESNPFEAVEEEISEVEEIPIIVEKPKTPKKAQPKLYECDYCSKQFYSRNSIVSHLFVTHKQFADYNCLHCSRKFKSPGNLRRHVKSMHEGVKKYTCDQCGAMFTEKYQLDRHFHNHDKPSACKICNKVVTNMKVHLRIHSKKRKEVMVECQHCSKKIGKYQLQRHIRNVHEKAFKKDNETSQMKVYPCHCGDVFSRREDLRRHEYVYHSQNKIYECSICRNVFRKLKLLNVHRFTHQPLNVKCSLCDKVYARKAALYKHTKKIHPEAYENGRNKKYSESDGWIEAEEFKTEV